MQIKTLRSLKRNGLKAEKPDYLTCLWRQSCSL